MELRELLKGRNEVNCDRAWSNQGIAKDRQKNQNEAACQSLPYEMHKRRI